MRTLSPRLGAMAFALAALLVLVTSANAQVRLAPSPQRIFPVNPNPEIAPGVRLQQFAYNTAVLGRVYSQIPPYLLGYNPYPTAVNYGPVVQTPYMPYMPPVYGGGGYSPYGASPYAGGYGAGGIDPLTGMPATGGYSSYNPSYPNPYGGGYNSGAGMDIMAYAQLGLSQEQARILREQANQAKLDTRKKTVDTLAYLRANEYTFTQEQIDIGKRLLERAQKVPTEFDVSSGKSLNVLLSDLVKFTNQPLRVPTVTLDKDILKLVNVCGSGSTGNVGLLRDNGRFSWPTAFDDKNVVNEKDRKEVESEAQTLYQQAANSKLDPNTVKNLESSLQALRTSLGKQFSTMPAASYLDAQRFLDNFDAAVIGLKKGDLILNLDFQQKFVKDDGKTVVELVDYMAKNGIRFAPAVGGDDRGYRALQTALAAHSLAIHQLAASGKEY